MTDDFDRLVTEAERRPVSGWDFSWLGERLIEDAPSWDYADELRGLLDGVDRLLDIDTGGGEFLSGFTELPTVTVVTEGWPPNLPVAARTLRPSGVRVVGAESAPDNDEQTGPPSGTGYPFRDRAFQFVANRHSSYWPTEVMRVLEPEGVFLTQQVGGRQMLELNEWLGEPPRGGFGAGFTADQLAEAGFEILRAEEEIRRGRFADVGAVVVYYLRMAPWRVESFSVGRHLERLRQLHQRIASEGALEVTSHRLLVKARRP